MDDLAAVPGFATEDADGTRAFACSAETLGREGIARSEETEEITASLIIRRTVPILLRLSGSRNAFQTDNHDIRTKIETNQRLLSNSDSVTLV